MNNFLIQGSAFCFILGAVVGFLVVNFGVLSAPFVTLNISNGALFIVYDTSERTASC